jgi:hypothetical protein
MYEFLLKKHEIKVVEEALSFIVNDVSPSLIKRMDNEEIVFPRDFIQAAGERRLLGLRFPRNYGGRNISWVGESVVIEEFGVLGFTLSCLYSMSSIVGEPIYVFGTKEQKENYLTPMLKGELCGFEAITEPSTGSDVFGGTKTRAVKKGNHFILNGQKRFVVGGLGADFFITYAVTNPKAPNPRDRLSAFIVERNHDIKVATIYGTLGTRGGGTARIVFKDTKVPEENLLGSINEGYKIFNRMMIPERMTSASGAIGAATAALEVAIKYSSRRKAFGRFIRQFQGVNFKIADVIMKIDASRGLVYQAAKAADTQLDTNYPLVRRLVSEAKAYATEAAWDSINNAIQILGGIGYTTVYPLERLLRDSRLGLIWTGTNEIMRVIIQHEIYKEILNPEYLKRRRNIEMDAVGADFEEEKTFE